MESKEKNRMSNKRKFVVAASVLAVTGFLLSGERAEAITANASSTIAAPIAIAETTALSFGFASSSGTSGTVEISLTGVQTATGGVGALAGSPSQGVFSVTGEGTSAFTTTMDPTSSLTGPGTAMTATLSNDAPANLTAGSATINVSGSLAVAASQVNGAYSGTYSITVNY